MPRLLIQCQGSPGPLSFIVDPLYAIKILQRYHRVPEHAVMEITAHDNETHYINLAKVSWICAIDEIEPEPETEPEHTRIPTRVL